LPTRFSITWGELRRGRHHPGFRWQLDQDGDALGLRGRLDLPHGVRDQPDGIDPLLRRPEPGLDLAEVEEVGDQLRHVARLVADALDTPLEREIALRLPRDELRGPLDHRDGVLQVVGDRVHEVVLHLVEMLQQGDVAQDGGHANRLAVRGDDGDEARLGRPAVAQRHLDRPGPVRLEQAAEGLVTGHVDQAAPDHGVGNEAEHGADRTVGQQDEPAVVQHDHGVRGAAEHGRERCARPPGPGRRASSRAPIRAPRR